VTSAPQLQLSGETEEILTQVREFCFPGGVDSARRVRVVKITEQGELRSAPAARWTPFTAQLEVDATRSRLRWDAGFKGFRVTDAYDQNRGRLTIAVAGIPVKQMTGPEYDKGELQRYLASFCVCPPMILNHPSLVCAAISPLTLRLRDVTDPTGATVDLDFSEYGSPTVAHAERPRPLGRRIILTPWLAAAADFREWEGLRVASRMEAAWRLPEGLFTYYRAEVTSFTIVE